MVSACVVLFISVLGCLFYCLLFDLWFDLICLSCCLLLYLYWFANLFVCFGVRVLGLYKVVVCLTF